MLLDKLGLMGTAGAQGPETSGGPSRSGSAWTSKRLLVVAGIVAVAVVVAAAFFLLGGGEAYESEEQVLSALETEGWTCEKKEALEGPLELRGATSGFNCDLTRDGDLAAAGWDFLIYEASDDVENFLATFGEHECEEDDKILRNGNLIMLVDADEEEELAAQAHAEQALGVENIC